MKKAAYTYNIKWMLMGILASQLILFLLLYLILGLVGYLDKDIRNEHVDFINPNAFYLFILHIPITILYFRNLKKTNYFASKTNARIRETWLKPVDSLRSSLKFICFISSLSFLIFTLAEPALGSKKTDGTILSMELSIALDVSSSMDVKDIDPQVSRLGVAKRAISELINGFRGEKIALTLFAGDAFVQLPLTTDYYAAKIFLDDINTGMVGTQGTNISNALNTAASVFSEDKNGKAILLITDGENHEDNPQRIFTKMKENKIEFFLLGLGTQSGGPVPKNGERPEMGYKENAFGSRVISKANPKFINDLIQKSGGSGMLSESAFPDLTDLTNKIKNIKRTAVKGMQFEVKENRYQYPLCLALIFAFFYVILGANKLSFKKDQV